MIVSFQMYAFQAPTQRKEIRKVLVVALVLVVVVVVVVAVAEIGDDTLLV